MRRHSKPGATLTVALALIAATVLAAGGPKADTEPAVGAPTSPAAEQSPGAPRATSPGRAGTRVYLDPETGRMRGRPSDREALEASRGMRDRLSTHGDDLIQEALPQGGFKVDLRGRFQSSVVATIDPETDEVTIDCIRKPAGDEAGDER